MIIQADCVTVIVIALKHKISVRNIANAAVNAKIVFQVAVVRHNVIPNSALAILLYVNVILIFVKLVGLINLMYNKFRVKMSVFKEECVS